MLGLAIVGPALSLVANVDQMRGSGNAYADELSGNGLFSLVTAFFLNELDYDRFYATLPDEKAFSILSGLGVARSGSWVAGGALGPDNAPASHLHGSDGRRMSS